MTLETIDESVRLGRDGSKRFDRNIIVFSDGTGNSSGKLFRTNVWRLYKAVDLEDPENLRHPRQFAYYDNGVGTSWFKPLALLGGAFGVGLARNVRDLYAFVCRTYRPGDRIYAFGFSRGAFTVRVLVGLMMNQGLVLYEGNEAELQRKVAAAYRAYRRERFTDTTFVVSLIRRLRDLVIASRDKLRGYSPYDKNDNFGLAGSKDPLRVKLVGVWDTVAAYGLPIDELTRAVDQYIWPLSMPDRDLSPRVDRALHALSLDDERNTFHPQLWNEGLPVSGTYGKPPNAGDAATISNERISQVWFAGVHSDVGGGYPDDSVSYVSLNWIMTEACKCEVRFCPRIWDEYRALSDENGPINDARRGLGGYYRYNPRRIERLTDTDEVKIARVKIHESVFRRIKVGQDGYAPIVLPSDFDVASIDGTIQRGEAYLNKPVSQQEVPKEGRPDDHGTGSSGPFLPSAYGAAREHVLNLVWWRRIAYFFTLGATLLLAAMPLIWPPLPKGACQSRLCFLADIIDPVAAVLPGFLTTWTDTFSSQPDVFSWIAAAILVGFIAGRVLEVWVRDAMRLIWYSVPNTTPDLKTPDGRKREFARPAEIGPFGERLKRLRSSPAYITTFRALTHGVLPVLFLLAVIYVATACVVQSVFAVRTSWGNICRPSTDNPAAVNQRTPPMNIRTDALCAPTGLRLDEGATYKLIVAVPPDNPWRDLNMPAGPYGIAPDAKGAGWLALGVPIRRYLSQPWFKPMGRIGSAGNDEYPLDPKPSIAKNEALASVPAVSCNCSCAPYGEQRIAFTSEIVARSTGELFFYVNDAIGVPPFTDYFYRNNEGAVCLTVERVMPTPIP
jgi:uncharacterized protein (DUF2235 family)